VALPQAECPPWAQAEPNPHAERNVAAIAKKRTTTHLAHSQGRILFSNLRNRFSLA